MNASEILLAGMLGLFLLAMGFVIIFILYQRRIISKDLEQQKMENDHRKTLLQAAIDSQEAERKRIAHDLHDEIGALLTTSKLYLNQLSPGRAEEKLEVVTEKVNTLFDEMMINIRRISHDLRPVILENLGLTEAVESIRGKVEDAGLQFIFIHRLSPGMTPSKELILYRIIQELINNTMKHASATCITLSLETKGDQFFLNYEDDGIGFTPSDTSPGLGLKSIETRLNLIKGSMQLMKLDQGVCFLIQTAMNNLTDLPHAKN